MRAYIRKAARRFAFEALTESGKGLTYVELRLASVELCFGWFVSTCKDKG